MKPTTLPCKVVYISLVLFISASPIFTMDLQPKGSPGSELSNNTSGLRDQHYYQEKLKELKESTARVQKKVDQVVDRFKRNLEAYYRLTKGSKLTREAEQKNLLESTASTTSTTSVIPPAEEEINEMVLKTKKPRSGSTPEAKMGKEKSMPPSGEIETKKPNDGLTASQRRRAMSTGTLNEKSTAESDQMGTLSTSQAASAEKIKKEGLENMLTTLRTKKFTKEGKQELEKLIDEAVNKIFVHTTQGGYFQTSRFGEIQGSLAKKLQFSTGFDDAKKILEDFMSNPLPVKKIGTRFYNKDTEEAREAQYQDTSQKLKALKENEIEKNTDFVMNESRIKSLIQSLFNNQKKRGEEEIKIRRRIKAMVEFYLSGGFGGKTLDDLCKDFKVKSIDDLNKKMETVELEVEKLKANKAHGADLDQMFPDKQISKDIPIQFDQSKFKAFVVYPIYDPKSVGAEGWLNFNKFDNHKKEPEFKNLIKLNRTGFVFVQSGVLPAGDIFGFSQTEVKVKIGHIDQEEVVYQLNIKTFTLAKVLGNTNLYELERQDQYYRIDIHDLKKDAKNNTEAFLNDLKDKVDQGYELWSIPVSASNVVFLAIPQDSAKEVICLNADSANEIPGWVYSCIKTIREKFMNKENIS